jgi:hypothetical protein
MKNYNPHIVGVGEAGFRTNSNDFNQATKNHQGIHEEINSAYNHHNIISAFKAGRAHDIGDCEKPPELHGEKQPCMIIGSGPSFDNNIEFLKRWKGGIFCTTSHALTLMYHGIEPTHIVCLDPFCSWSEIKGIDWSRTKTKLVAHPGIWPDIIENWPNELCMYLENIGNPNSFYATTQKHQYSWRGQLDANRQTDINHYIKTEITLFACSPSLQIFCASCLGYGTQFMYGLDLGFHSGKERFTNYTLDDGEWIRHEHPLSEVGQRPVMRSLNGLLTESIYFYYKKNILSSWVCGGQTLYSMDYGIITEMPHAFPQDVIQSGGYGYRYQSPEEISDMAEPYLASVGAYVLHSNAGQGSVFIECGNPFSDLPDYMRRMNRQFSCPVCGSLFGRDDDMDASGMPCPACEKAKRPGKLVRHTPIDVESNMERIAKYIAKGKLLV